MKKSVMLFCSRYILQILLSVLLFLVQSNVFAQAKTPQQKLDSIFLVDRAHPKEDSIKLVIYKAIYRQLLRMKEFTRADDYIDKSVSLARKINLRWYEADAFHRRALSYHGVANYIKAQQYYERAIEVFALVKDEDMEAGMYLNLGALFQGIPDYAKSLEYSQKAIEIYQKIGNENDLASVYANVGNIYKDLGQNANALNYLQKALKYFIKPENNSPRGVAVVYNSIGSAYFKASDSELTKMGVNPSQKYEKTLENLNKGLKVALELNDESVLSTTYKDLGLLFEKTNKRDLALQAYLKSIDYAKQLDNKTDYGSSLLALANFYTQEQAYARAVPLLNEALKIGDTDQTLELQRDAYGLLSTINEKQGNYTASLENYKKYINVKDQIFNEEKEKEITRKQLQIDFAVKEKDYQLKQQVTDGELQKQFLLAKQQQQELALRQQQLALSDKEKSLQRLTFLKKQADLENEKRFQSNLLSQQKVKEKLDEQIKEKQKSQLLFNEKVNLFLGALAVVLFASGLFVYHSQRKTSKLNKLVSEQKLELERLGRVKDRIFSVVSHDMRTPVNSLISFIQLLEGGAISQEKLTKYAGNLKNTLGYTSTMMENLLNWASSQMQGFKPVIEKFDIHNCAQEVANSMEAVATQKNIVIKNEIKSETFCFADSNMSALVLRNLLSNAIKFTPGYGTITIRSELKTDRIAIEIQDTGIGLSPEQLIDFNQPGYHETGKSTLGTNKEKGTGIGLVLCKTFVTMMNGSLKAKSEINQGSVFTLSLPKEAA